MEGNGLGFGALALALTAALASCGEAAGETPVDLTGAGTGGSAAGARGGSDDSGGESSASAAGDGGSGGSDEVAGRCIEDAPLPEDVIVTLERCLDPEALVQDLALLDGSSFVLRGNLCRESWQEETVDESSLSSLHFRRVGDDLELVSSLPTRAAPFVQRSTLERTSVGFAATDLVVCSKTVYDLEDAYAVRTYEAPLVHLAFVPGSTPGELELVLAARLETDDATEVLDGTPDLTRPSFSALDVPGEYLDGYEAGYEPEQPGGVEPPYHFFFDEPVLAGALSLDDGEGGRVPLEPIESQGFIVGFRVEDLVLGEPTFDLTVSDLAGNAWKPGETYPGVTLEPTTDGDLESAEQYVASQPYWPCSETGLLAEDELTGSPPLRGERSLFLDGCAAYFRVQRSAGATTLTFEMRAYAPSTELEVRVRAIGANGAETSSKITPEPPSDGSEPPAAAEWPLDPEYASEETFVSMPAKISVPLPAEGDELILRIGSNERLWLDALVTE